MNRAQIATERSAIWGTRQIGQRRNASRYLTALIAALSLNHDIDVFGRIDVVNGLHV